MQKVSGMKQRVRGSKFQEHFNQAQLFYNSLAPYEKAHLIDAIAFELSHVEEQQIYETYTKILNNIDFDMAKSVAEKVNGEIPKSPARDNHGMKTPTLSQLYYLPKTPTIASRRIAILVADGFNAVEVAAVRAAFKAGKATTWIIGPRRGKAYPSGEIVGKGPGIFADHHFEGQRSTMFDALYVPSGAEHAKTLLKTGRAIHWIREAFGHCKAIGAVGDGTYCLDLFLTLLLIMDHNKVLLLSSMP